MQNKSILRKLIPVILILSLIWGVFILSRFILQEPEYSHLNFLPEYADWSAQVDVRQLMDKGVPTIIFGEDDPEIKEMLQDFVSNQEGQFQDFSNYGIQLNSSVLLFGWENNSIIGASINLSDVEKFNTNFSKELSSKFACYGENNVGIILYSTIKTVDAENLLLRAKQILSQPRIGQTKSKFDLSIQLHSKNVFTKDFANGTINVQFTDKKVLISGEMDSLTEQIPQPTSCIKGDGFHVELVNLSKDMSDSILNALNFDLPQLSSVSINYFGAELITEPALKIALNMNSIFTTQEPLTIDYQNDSVALKKLAPIKEQGFEVEILNQNTIYIGRKKFTENMLKTSPDYLKIMGIPSYLTTLKGEGLTRKLIGIVPLFKASEKLSNSIQNIDLNVRIINNDKAKISGTITFKDDKFALNELLKFILISQQ